MVVDLNPKVIRSGARSPPGIPEKCLEKIFLQALPHVFTSIFAFTFTQIPFRTRRRERREGRADRHVLSKDINALKSNSHPPQSPPFLAKIYRGYLTRIFFLLRDWGHPPFSIKSQSYSLLKTIECLNSISGPFKMHLLHNIYSSVQYTGFYPKGGEKTHVRS